MGCLQMVEDRRLGPQQVFSASFGCGLPAALLESRTALMWSLASFLGGWAALLGSDLLALGSGRPRWSG
jgi:hypothetical protein